MKNNGWGIAVVCILLFLGLPVTAAPLVVDHTAVARYADIPQLYIDKVKAMWADVPGESHSLGYRKGCALLQGLDSRLQVSVKELGTPEGHTNAYLRISRATWSPEGWGYGYGEANWYASTSSVEKTKAHLSYCNTNGLEIAAMGFVWCWDMLWHNEPGGGIDPVYQVRWAGASEGGPDGDLRWGLDADDYALTGNHVNMDTYLRATQEYDDFCRTNGYRTRVFFTTGPADGGWPAEGMYQRHLKHERIRSYVAASADGILFDYADILCWSDSGQQATTAWTDYGGTRRVFQSIHPDNMLDLNGTYAEDGDHIGERGAVRLGKALWYMLARLAGWDPDLRLQIVPLANGQMSIQVHGQPGVQYTVETADSLAAGQWTALLTVNSSMMPFVFIDSRPPASQQFYRLVQR